jgi:endothelin-converting enzyme/putative endopeptidase
MNISVDAFVDFYAYACGGWLARNPIPADQARWSVYGKLYDENQRFLWGLLQAAAEPRATRTPNEQKIGDYYAACMDEPAVEKAGAAPLFAEMGAVDALDKPGLGALLARLHTVLDTTVLFNFGADQDPGDSSRVIAFASAGGLGLPDRDYYLSADDKSKEIRDKYGAHVAATFRLLGRTEADASKAAATVMRMETALAKASLTNVEKRDPRRIYHLTRRVDLQKQTPSFAWDAYLSGMGLSTLAELNLTEPAFYAAVEVMVRDEPLAAWQDYIRWHLVRGRSPYLSEAFVKENFAFYGTTLRGVKEMRPRWKRCVAGVDRDLGEALGQVFVEKAFPPPVKQATLDMVKNVEKAMESRLRELPWMGADTRKRASPVSVHRRKFNRSQSASLQPSSLSKLTRNFSPTPPIGHTKPPATAFCH